VVRVGARATSMAETGRGWLRIFGGHCRAPGPDLPSFPRRHTDVTERSLGLAWTSPTLDACRTGRAPSRRSRLGPPAPRRLMRLLTAVHLDRPPGEGLLEASGDTAVGQDTEEWAPLQFFARSRSTPTFFISAGGRDLHAPSRRPAPRRPSGGGSSPARPPRQPRRCARPSPCALPLADGVEEPRTGRRRSESRSSAGWGGGREPGLSRVRTRETWDTLRR